MVITKRTVAITLAATFLPLGIAVGSAMGGIMKLTNPEGLDVTQGLAYLSYSIVPALVVMAAASLTSLLLTILVWRQDGKRAALLPLALLGVNVALGIGILGFREMNGVAQDNWSRAHGLPTRAEKDKQTDEFFKALEQKN